jgi:hypothetical protein
MRIAELNHNQTSQHNTQITVVGVVRVTYPKPFPYFLLEDESGTLICRPSGNLPCPGAHLQITGLFVLETPENCTVEIAGLKERNRTHVAHPTDTCNLPGCDFATQAAA